MADAIRLRFDSGQVERVLDQLGDRGQSVMVRAMSRTGTSARARLARGISTDMGLAVGTVRDELKIHIDRGESPFVSITASAKQIPLVKFRARGPFGANAKRAVPSRGKGRGVTARLPPPGAGRYPHAFFAQMHSSGHIGVFRRQSPLTHKSPGAWGPNLPILELKGPSIWHVGHKLAAAEQERFRAVLLKNLEHEVGFALAQVAR